MGQGLTRQERRERIRKLKQLAAELAADHPRGRIFAPKNLKAFQAAFVEVSLRDPFRLTEDAEGTVLYACDVPIGRASPAGHLTLLHDRLLPHVLGPSNIRALADMAYNHECEALIDAYQSRQPEILDIDHGARGYDWSRPRALEGLARRAVKAFCAKLQPEPLRALRRAMMASADHRHVAESVLGPAGWKWAQAIQAYPAAINWATVVSRDSRAAVVDAIASGKPLLPVLARALDSNETEIKRLRGVTPQLAGRYPGQRALRLIFELPQHLRPRTRRDWNAGIDIAWSIQKGHAFDFPVGMLFRGQKDPLSSIDPTNALRTMTDVIETIQSMRPHAQGMLRRLVTFTLAQLLSLNRDYHVKVVHATHRLRAEAARHNVSPKPWPRVMPGKVMDLGTVTATELTTPAELVEEGSSLEHCVAAYAAECYEGRSRIVSLRCTRTGARSTLELGQVLIGRQLKLETLQHEGPNNTKPRSELAAAAATLVRTLNQQRMEHWPQLPDESPKAVGWNAIMAEVQPWLLRRVKPLEDPQQAAA